MLPAKKVKYGVHEARQIRLKKKFCLAVATKSIPTSIKTSFEFCDYIEDLDPRHTIPGRKGGTAGIRRLYSKGKEVFKKGLFTALWLLILTADIWSKPGFSSSYLGITVHYISAAFKLESAVLELVYFPDPSTGKAISELINKVLDEWGIAHLVSTIITDNASNMIKTFKQIRMSTQVLVFNNFFNFEITNDNLNS